MRHYVCDQCKTVSQYPGTCPTDTCLNYGSPLKECTCEDGLHAPVLSNLEEEEKFEGEEDSKPGSTIDLDASNEA